MNRISGVMHPTSAIWQRCTFSPRGIFAACVQKCSRRRRILFSIPPMASIGVAIVGCGGITLQNHLPELALCPSPTAVALCDPAPATLERAAQQTGIKPTSTKYEETVTRDDVQAVIIATPHVTHAPIALA